MGTEQDLAINEIKELSRIHDIEVRRLQEWVKELRSQVKHLRGAVESQGKQCMRRHEIICELHRLTTEYFEDPVSE